ncbi:multiprotein-bridging factor 1 family protein [uncultured Parasutterella sp.]|uniref:multiprotein-bridging factor 1 family protein n=1 Tax=uncultured Parasutterella sp. TaxID=1263098 RepID=UPI0034A482E3
MITEYGKAVRKARITLGITMSQMANELKCSLAYLSAMENGKRPIPIEYVKMTEAYFVRMGLLENLNLKALADLSNQCVCLKDLTDVQNLIVEIAQTELSDDDVRKMHEILTNAKNR